MASRAMPGIINYKATCKQCDWVFESDSTSKVQDATSEHRNQHWINSPRGKMEERRRMREFYYSKRQEYARMLERAREALDDEIRFLAATDKMIGKRDETVNKIAELRERVERNQRMFDITDKQWGAYL